MELAGLFINNDNQCININKFKKGTVKGTVFNIFNKIGDKKITHCILFYESENSSLHPRVWTQKTQYVLFFSIRVMTALKSSIDNFSYTCSDYGKTFARVMTCKKSSNISIYRIFYESENSICSFFSYTRNDLRKILPPLFESKKPYLRS